MNKVLSAAALLWEWLAEPVNKFETHHHPSLAGLGAGQLAFGCKIGCAKLGHRPSGADCGG